MRARSCGANTPSEDWKDGITSEVIRDLRAP